MSVARSVPWHRGLASSVVLGGFLVYLAWSVHPEWAGVLLALAGVVSASLLRRRADALSRSAAPIPLVVVLGIVAVALPKTTSAEILVGGAAVLWLAWLADDPRRRPGGVARAIPTLAIVGFTVVVAWGSSTLLAYGSVSLGVAAVLLVAVVALVSILVARPELIRGEEAASS